jgi:hypothetical protein
MNGQLTVQTIVENISNRYHAQISILRTSALVEELMLEFGDPFVNVGGNFSGQVKRPGESEYTQVSFTLPTRHRRLDSDFPVTQVFDLKDDCDSDLKAKLWVDEVCDRIEIAKNDLLTKRSSFTGETVKTI